MSRYDMKLPDVGEGVAEAELVEWLVAIGDEVTPDTVIAEVLTDKATVEVSAPVAGTVVQLHGEPGDNLAVGSDFIAIETGQGAKTDEESVVAESDSGEPMDVDHAEHGDRHDPSPVDDGMRDDGRDVGATGDRAPEQLSRQGGGRAIAAPAVRARATDLGLDLATIDGSGPDGRVLHSDLDRVLRGGAQGRPPSPTSRRLTDAPTEGHDVQVRGVRRRIAERLSAAWRDIPHITYVDDVDATELERLRTELNLRSDDRGVRLTLLPFIGRAVVIALADQPDLNAHYDHSEEVVTTFEAVHLGIATQTDDGLRVPVVRHAEGRGVWGLAAEIARVTRAARDGSAARDDLAGSTVTITSLGALGGLVTTPIINPPELVIVGVNKMETRPVWRDGAVQARAMLNLSSSFDHRMVDGWDAATFVGRVKQLLETPALLFATDD